MTTKIIVPEFIRRWVLSTYKIEGEGAAVFSEKDDIYHIVSDVLTRRGPGDPMTDTGNLEIKVPKPRYGKDPRYFNYISPKGTRIIVRKLRALFYISAHEFIYGKEKTGAYTIKESAYLFMVQYDLDGTITEDALIKDYQRWRKKFSRHKE